MIKTLCAAPEVLAVINASPAHWLEERAQQLAALIQRLKYLINARNAIIRVWGVGQPKVDAVLLEAEDK